MLKGCSAAEDHLWDSDDWSRCPYCPPPNVGATLDLVPCPNCGRCEYWTATFRTSVTYSISHVIDAGDIVYDEEEEHPPVIDWKPSDEFLFWSCSHCGHQTDDPDFFDPTTKIAEMMAGLEALAEEYEHE